jgi:hypothetical protein
VELQDRSQERDRNFRVLEWWNEGKALSQSEAYKTYLSVEVIEILKVIAWLNGVS